MLPSSPLDFSKFYELSDPFATRPLRLTDAGYSECITLDQIKLLSTGQLRLDAPLKLGTFQGGQATDILWSGLVRIICISTRVRDMMVEKDVTGWDTYPVKVHDRQGIPLPAYHGLAVIGGNCRLDISRSQIVTKPRLVPQGREHEVYKGLYFYESDWDGSDMFWLGNARIVVTEKVHRLLKKSRISNVKLIPLTEAERDVLLDKYER